MKKILFIFIFFIGASFSQVTFSRNNTTSLILGAENTDAYFSLLKNKRIGLVVNQSSVIGKQHLIDFLIEKKVNVTHLYSPEHGIRGKVLAGIKVGNSIDQSTKLPITSLYGKNKKPTAQQLADVDVLIFDIQDVGVRYFTYISTLHYVMEAAAENNKTVIVLDRPNPNGEFIDGPVMTDKYKSFIGMHKIPVLHGLTIGELALMINGQGWLKKGIKLQDLYIAEMLHYRHHTVYSLPVSPSPNLPNDLSVKLYPSLGLFESTTISVGRGTDKPFQLIGFNDKKAGNKLAKVSTKGWPQKGNIIFGDDLTRAHLQSTKGLNISLYIHWYQKLKSLGYKNSEIISRRTWLAKLMGNDIFYQQVISGKTSKQIKASWQIELDDYKQMRKKYLLYP